jgi:Ser-tRNA(Ala) deacylase AlaX
MALAPTQWTGETAPTEQQEWSNKADREGQVGKQVEAGIDWKATVQAHRQAHASMHMGRQAGTHTSTLGPVWKLGGRCPMWYCEPLSP